MLFDVAPRLGIGLRPTERETPRPRSFSQFVKKSQETRDVFVPKDRRRVASQREIGKFCYSRDKCPESFERVCRISFHFESDNQYFLEDGSCL